MAVSHEARSASVSAIHCFIFCMFATGCRVSASTNSQRSSAASSWPTVVFPAPATPITTIILAVTMLSPVANMTDRAEEEFYDVRLDRYWRSFGSQLSEAGVG